MLARFSSNLYARQPDFSSRSPPVRAVWASADAGATEGQIERIQIALRDR